jgi:phospholipid-binding lipoprotein MlaA
MPHVATQSGRIFQPRQLDPTGGAKNNASANRSVTARCEEKLTVSYHKGWTNPVSALAFGLLLCCCGCAASPSDPATADDTDSDNDPAERVNRAIFKANLAADHAVMKPVAQAYSDHVPEVVQTGVHNVVQNLKEPAVAVNDLLQGNVNHAWQAVERLAVNTTVGVAGVVDVAAKWGLPPHKADFGQTLAVWGVGEGPFVELPLLGPSNPRDAVGTAVDLALNPLTFVGGAPATYAGVATGGANVVDTRVQHLEDLDALERNSLDYYATLRSVYRQHREAEINKAKEPEGRVDISFPDTNPGAAPPADSGKK